MKLLLPLLVLFLFVSCEGPMFSPEDEAAIRQTLLAEVADGDDGLLSAARATTFLEALDTVQSPEGLNLERILFGLAGLVGAFFGVRSQVSLTRRPRTLPDPADAVLLRSLIARERVAREVLPPKYPPDRVGDPRETE